jgi:hypothetical protein
MITWIKQYAHMHLFYIILIVGGVFAFHVWLQEHDARIAADNVVKQQIAVVTELKAEIATTQAQAAQKVQVVKQVVAKATTPSEIVAALPKLTPLPLNTRPVPDSPIDVEVAALPLLQLAGDDKETHIQLEACQQVGDLKDKQLAAKDVEITALKKKPRFFTRVKHVAEAVGIGIGIGVLLVR